MTKRLSDEEVYNYIESCGCEWVDGEYNSNSSKLTILFQCGCTGDISLNNFKSGRRCRKHQRILASEKRRTSLDEIKNNVEDGGFTFIELVGGYGRKSIIRYSCTSGHITERYYKDFLNHPNCGECMIEYRKIRYRNSTDGIVSIVDSMGCSIIEIIYYVNRKDSLLKIEFSCGHQEELSLGNFQGRKTGLCVNCELESRQGETAYAWRGGITQLSSYLRTRLKEWNKYCANYYSYKCVITGLPMDDIHHLYSFNLILKETLDTLDLKTGRKSIKDYSNLELDSVVMMFFDIQSKYPIGVPITKKYHNLFHKMYGRGNNTPEQFYEFVQRIRDGEIEIE